MSYRVLDDNVGYLRVASFENGLGEGNISDVLYSLRMCRASSSTCGTMAADN